MSPPSAGGARPLAERVLSEQMRMIIGQTPQGVAGPAALAAIGTLVVWEHVAREPLVIALAALLLVQLWWLWFYLRYRRQKPAPGDAEDWARGTLLRTAVHGCCWGAFSLVIFRPDSFSYQSLDVAFMYGLVAGAVVVDGPHFPSFVVFAVPTLLPVVVRCFVEGTVTAVGAGAAGLVGLLHGLFAALNASRITTSAIRARFENLDLVRALEQAREAAELARARAEAANREKSRFLAAASHDLRQPVHALGLFAAAAQRAPEAERPAIIDRIEASAASLSTLFDSLLEVSRLDAGTLQPRLCDVPVAELLRELAAGFAPEARDKKLAFRLRCRELTVRTDPVLLERLLRNLVANAIRYTTRGGVLLACRKRGDKARIEVCDTGAGIAPEQLELVFEEFYQVDNPERDRRKGVGLGLAIVKRIAALLGHELHVTSRVGRGSRFAIDVPLSGPGAVAGARDDPASGTDEAVLLGSVIVVIDDEPDVLAGVELALKQCGCRVITAESVEQACARLDSEGVEPDVVVSDYRLRGEETGLGAVQKLRSDFGAALPAVLVTGDTAPERLLEVNASGLELLHKPVAPERLKRTLSGLLAR